MFISIKNFTLFTSIIGLFGLANIVIANSAQAYSVTFSNGDFENSVDFNDNVGWDGVGNTTIEGTYSGVNPIAGIKQAVITNACPSTIQSGECLDNDGNGLPRNDDSATSAGTFNGSGNDQISASIETTNNLQSLLGLSNNAFSIYREIGGITYDGTNGNPVLRRTPKEGSAIYQDITITDDGSDVNDFALKFNWDFLTNDGAGDLGNKDFGFVSITNASGFERIFSLGDSTGSIPTLTSNQTNFATNSSSYASYISSNLSLTPGVYRVGFGVIDVDGVGYSSGLLVDDFGVKAVPFEFSPTLGLLIVGGMAAGDRLRRKLISKVD